MTNHSRRGGLRVAVGNLFVAAIAVAAAGCDLSTGEATVTGIHQFVQVRGPVGHVQGVVVDSNGRPLQNARVTIGSRQTTTNNAGAYEFRDLEVVNATTTTDNDTDHDALRIVVAPTASTFASGFESSPTSTNIRFLGTIVRVYPEAQLNSVGGNSGLVNCSGVGGSGNQSPGSADCTNVGSQSIFVDGFRVEADIAVLPELNASAEVLALRDATTGQLVPSGTSVTLDFVDIRNSDSSTEEDGSDSEYPTVAWTGSVNSSGNVSFSGLPANSRLRMHVRGYICQESGADTSDNDNQGEPDTCEIATENETNVVTYRNFFATLLTDRGDLIVPFVRSVTGVYTRAEPIDATRCDDGDLGANKIGKLLRDVDGTSANGGFRLAINEALQSALPDETSAVVFDYTQGNYESVADVVASGSTVTVTTDGAVPEGSEISIFLFRPDFLDLAGNAIDQNVSGDTFASSAATLDCVGEIVPEEGSGTSYLALDLERFKEPSTDTDAAVPVQEEVDPTDTGSSNDFPLNQARSAAFNDVRDNTSGLEQMNNSNDDPNNPFGVDVALVRRAEAFGELLSGFVQNFDMARIEWAPVPGATGYAVNVNGDTVFLSNDALDTDEDSTGCTLNSETCYFGTETRGVGTEGVTGRTGTLFYILIDGSTEGDVVTITGLDELGNPGDSASVTVVDNVQPTVIVQRSYQNVHQYSQDGDEDNDDLIEIGGDEFEIQTDASGDNISGCYVDGDTNIPITAEHAGVALQGGSAEFGDGGELSQGGSDDAFGNLCIGVGPELLADAGANSGNVGESVHDELEGGRDADFDAQGNDTVDNFDRGYDATAFAAWAALRPEIRMGAAFSEGLAPTVGAVAYSGTADLSDYLVQNNVADSHLGEDNGTINDIVTFLVDDAYAMANADHFQVLDFDGAVSDVAGNTAIDGEADAELTVRDMWPPYVASGQLNATGSVTATFDSELLVEDESDNDTLIFRDADGDSITFTFDDDEICSGETLNYVLSGAGSNVVDIPVGCVPDNINAAFDSAGLNYDGTIVDTDHAVVDFSNIGDTRGNSWDVLDWADDFSDDQPLFIMPSQLAVFAVSVDDGADTIVDGAGTDQFTFIVTASHPMGNLFTTGGNGGGEAPMFNPAFLATDCTGDDSEITTTGAPRGNPDDPVVCDDTFVANYLALNDVDASADICVVDTASQAVFSADLTTVTFTVQCDAGTQLTATDEVSLAADNVDTESRIEYGSTDTNDPTIAVQ